jgi:hypothetical protein
VADWQTVASLATAAGTTVLAIATFAATRSANRSARVAEEALRANMRPLLVPSAPEDPVRKVLWSDMHHAALTGNQSLIESANDVVYVAIGLRNVGSGLALLHGWCAEPDVTFGAAVQPPDLDEFRRLTIDLYVPTGGAGYFEAAVRDVDDPLRAALLQAIEARQPVTVHLLYGDQNGWQRTMSRFTVLPRGDGTWYSQAGRHWNLDRPDPR